jgi:agmatinase
MPCVVSMRQLDAMASPRFSQPATYARLPYTRDLSGVRAAFVGVPFDDATSFRPGARFGPAGIREGSRLLRPYNMFLGVYPFEKLNACDYGDVDVVPGFVEDTMSRVEGVIREVSVKCTPFIAGGDHSITLPVLRALSGIHGRLNLVHFDSHFDFWDNYWGKRYTHGTWLRRALEEGLVNKVIQVGIRGSVYSHTDVEDSVKLGTVFYTAPQVKRDAGGVLSAINGLSGKTYVSVDIDCVDPAYAPGTGTPEVGGLTSLELIELLRGFRVDMVGFDVVEVSPPYDHAELTSMLAANLIYEAMSVLALKSTRVVAP